MKMYKEESLTSFNFWSGAIDTVKYLNETDLEQIESILEDGNPDGMTETQINDFFWFEEDTISKWLGYSDFEELVNDRTEKEE